MKLMSKEMIQAHLDVAERYSQLSKAKRLKVGALIVTEGGSMFLGYNGTPPGWDNVCESEVQAEDGSTALVTKPEVIHAEENALAKVARSTERSQGAVMFMTHSPCLPCAKMMSTCGISHVYYRNQYRNTDGIDHLLMRGVQVTQIPE